MPDLSQYGTVSKAPPDLSQYGVITSGTSGDDGSGVVKGFVQNSPVGAVKGIADFIRHPIDTASAMAHQNAALLDKAKDAYERGDYTGALFHTLNYFLPTGTALDDAGQDFQQGHVARGTAKTLGLASTLVAGAKAPALLDATTNVSQPNAGGSTISTAARAVARKVVAKTISKTTGIPSTVVNTVMDSLKAGADQRSAAGAEELQPHQIWLRDAASFPGESTPSPEINRNIGPLAPQPGFDRSAPAIEPEAEAAPPSGSKIPDYIHPGPSPEDFARRFSPDPMLDQVAQGFGYKN